MAESRFAEPTFIGRAWHADGRPYTAQDYRDAGLTPPTKSQIALWEEADAERARRPPPILTISGSKR